VATLMVWVDFVVRVRIFSRPYVGSFSDVQQGPGGYDVNVGFSDPFGVQAVLLSLPTYDTSNNEENGIRLRDTEL